VASALRELHAGFSRAQPLVDAPYLARPDLAAAYALVHAPLSVAKGTVVLGGLAVPAVRRTVRVLDVGAGPLALCLAAADRLDEAGRTVRLVAGDQCAEVLELGTAIAQRLGLSDRLTTARWVLPDPASPAVVAAGPYDWILAGNLLNELPAGEEETGLLGRLAGELLAQEGRLVVIEPPQAFAARPLLAARAHLLRMGLRVVAPCPHADPCSAWDRPGAPCRPALRWEPPPTVARLARPAGVDHSLLDFSYLVVGR